MNKQTHKYVINQQTLENFERASTVQDTDQEPILDKPVRDPRINKERDQRRQNKRDRWDD